MDKYILAHDLGTSSNKACLFNERGQVVAEETVNYTTYYGKNGEAEQAHEDWWNAVVIGTRRVLERAGVSGAAVAAVGLSAQMNSLVPVDRSGKPITERCMTWMDMRGKEQAAFVLEKFGQQNYYRLCGSSVELTIMQFTKLMWMKDHRPEEYARIYKVLGVKEYIVQRLTGRFGENDFSDAYAAGMMNINTSKYEKDFLALIGIPRKILCDPVPSTTVIGAVTPQAAAATGLSEETKVVLGCGDGISCYIGAGGLMKDTMIATFGTASWISMTAERAIMEDGYQAGVTPLDDGRYYINMHSGSCYGLVHPQHSWSGRSERLCAGGDIGSGFSSRCTWAVFESLLYRRKWLLPRYYDGGGVCGIKAKQHEGRSCQSNL